MSRTTVPVAINDLLLKPLDDYAASHNMSRDFVIAVAVDQFLSDPDNQITA